MIVYTFESLSDLVRVTAFDKDTAQIVQQYEGNIDSEARQFEINFINAGYKRVLTHDQRNQLIAEWNQADQQQKFWRQKELALRSSLVSEMYTKEKGTERHDLDGGWELLIERGLDYKLENKNGETSDVLEDIPFEIATLLVKWKPELSATNYNQTTQEIRDKFNAILTIKPASPSVKLVPPKATKG